jgi:5-methylcytosine-specific restriction endonuclease McrA
MSKIKSLCLSCKKEFEAYVCENRKYCTRSCSAKVNNKLTPKRKKNEKQCKKCNVIYVPWKKSERILCKNCFEANDLFLLEKRERNRNITIMELKEKHGKLWKDKARKLCTLNKSKILKNQNCQLCEENTCLELAHIIQISDANPEMKMSELHDLNNILFLCPNHHTLFDKQQILLSSIPLREGQTERRNRDYIENNKKEFRQKSNRSIKKPNSDLTKISNDPNMVNCEFCKNYFLPNLRQKQKKEKNLPVFCSRYCLISYSRDAKNKKNRSVYENRTISYYTSLPKVKTLHPSYRYMHIRRFCRRWNKHLLTQPCKFCGSTESIELAHIKPISSFPKETKLGIVNNPNNVIPLCSNCHKKFDSKQTLLSL